MQNKQQFRSQLISQTQVPKRRNFLDGKTKTSKVSSRKANTRAVIIFKYEFVVNNENSVICLGCAGVHPVRVSAANCQEKMAGGKSSCEFWLQIFSLLFLLVLLSNCLRVLLQFRVVRPSRRHKKN